MFAVKFVQAGMISGIVGYEPMRLVVLCGHYVGEYSQEISYGTCETECGWLRGKWFVESS